jgi:hypothetical protein
VQEYDMRPLTRQIVLFSIAGLLYAAPSDLDTSYQALKDAVAKHDAALVKQLAAETSVLARAAAATPAPAEPAGKDAWTKQVAYAREVDQYTEYALSAAALASEPATTIDLLSTLEKQNPKSRYLDSSYSAYFEALQKTGAAAEIPAIATKALANLPENEDLLAVLIENNLSRRQMAAAGALAERLLNALKRHAVPEGTPPADWERKRTALLMRASWTAGMAHAEKNEYALCDKDLRVALPLVKGNESMLAPTLYFLGVSNYHVGRMAMDRMRILEAAKFSEQAAAIRSPYQQQAWTDARLMRAEADRMLARK